MEVKEEKTTRKPLIRISRKQDFPRYQKILIKLGTIIFSILLCAFISNCISSGSFGVFLQNVFVNNFASVRKGVTSFSLQKTISLLWSTAILFLIAPAVTPAFKMKFWNIGG